MLSGISWFIRLSGVSWFSVFVWWLIVYAFGVGGQPPFLLPETLFVACFVLCVVCLLCDLVLGLIIVHLEGNCFCYVAYVYSVGYVSSFV